MSDNSSKTESTRTAADIRQDIADYVLNHADEMSDVSGVKEFVEEHGRLTKEIAEGGVRLERLAEAKEEYEPLEQRVSSGRKALKNAEAELPKLYRPLGEAAFKAFVAGDIEEQPVFEDRHTIHKKVQELQDIHDSLSPEPNAGIAQKAKAKTKRVAITSVIKMEKLEFRRAIAPKVIVRIGL